MPEARTSPLSYLFTLFARGLLKRTAAKASLLPPLLTPAIAALLTRRMFRIRNRFQALLDRFLAGTLPPPRPPPPAAPPRPQAKPRPAPPIELSPRYIAEMLSRIPEASWTCRGFLAQIIDNEADTRELVAASPAAASYLRTFCRMTGRPRRRPWLAAAPQAARVSRAAPPALKKPPDAWKRLPAAANACQPDRARMRRRPLGRSPAEQHRLRPRQTMAARLPPHHEKRRLSG